MTQPTRSPLVHWLTYSGQGILVSLAGLIFLPLYTRLLGPDDYGGLAILDLAVGLALAVASLGLPQASVRFYWPAQKEGCEQRFATTQVLLGLMSGAMLSLILVLIAVLSPSGHPLRVLLLAAPLVVVGTVVSVLLSIDLAAERSSRYAAGRIAERFLVLGAGALGYLACSRLGAIYAARALAALALLGALLWHRWQLLAPRHFDARLVRQSVLYGAPLILVAVESTILSFGDRYIIAYFLGGQAVGVYSASYNLASGLAMLIASPFSLFAQPAYMRIWSEGGEQAVSRLLRRLSGFYFLLAVPLVAGIWAIGGSLLTAVTSPEYAGGVGTMVYVCAAVVLYGFSYLGSAGLFIQRRTHVVGISLALGIGVNVVLNILLIPAWGIEGAAFSTLMSYVFYTSLVCWLGWRQQKFSIDWRRLGTAIASSACMFLLLWCLGPPRTLLQLARSGAAGLGCYGAVVLLLDREVRGIALSRLPRLSGRKP